MSIELEKQVVCRELSQKIEKLGVKQDSLWWWHIYKTNDFCANQNNLVFGKPTFCGDNWADDYSAFTVAELLELLLDGEIIIYVTENNNWDGSDYIKLFRNPNNLAECLIWLIENKKLKL